MSRSFLKGTAVGFVCAVLGGATVALAGSGVGGVFNLGQTNTVNAQSTLTGSTNNPQLSVQNTNTGGNAFAIGATNASSSGPAVSGSNTAGGPGVRGSGQNGVGVFGQTASATAPAVKGQSTAGGAGGVFTSAGGVGLSGNGATTGGQFASAGTGVNGSSTGGGTGGNFTSASGVGVHGSGSTFGGQFVSAGTGVSGTSTGSFTVGVKGSDNTNPGYGVWGESKQGTGVYGSGGNHGGFFTSPGVGLEGASTGDDGVRGGSTAANKSGVWGHHDGNKTSGYGVFASSDNGPALGLSQGSGNAAAPVTLNGVPFPSATVIYNEFTREIANDTAFHTMATLSLPAGDYAILAKGELLDVDETAVEPGLAFVHCELVAGSDNDKADAVLQGPGGIGSISHVGPTSGEDFTMMVFHHFAAPGNAIVQCLTHGEGVDPNGPQPIDLADAKMMAIRVSGGSNAAD